MCSLLHIFWIVFIFIPTKETSFISKIITNLREHSDMHALFQLSSTYLHVLNSLWLKKNHFLHFISGNTQWGHEKENATLLTEFILTGLIYQPEWQIPLFLLFLMTYLITILGNLGLIALICNDPHLHIPMYLFLGNLAFVDAWISSTMTPQLLVNFFAKSKMMSLTECKIQFFSFAVSVTTECFLLATMAYANHYFTQLLWPKD